MTTRGTLRIYLGYAAGVGKTFAMLGEGLRRRERGTDVVVGFVETHGRPKTRERLGDLEVTPRRSIEYRGTHFEEMNVDAILARAPEIALIDELAHTNVPGSRNEKRWQDVEELLEAGIDVISTVNVQHLESLNDVVERITGAKQRETIPDEVVRAADQVELVDMTPFALRRRMAHGNIYPAEKIDAALANYFREGNLGALRELALLWMADRVDEALQDYMRDHDIEGPWETRERILVGVSGRAEDEPLIRRAARMATRRGGELLAVHVIPEAGPEDVPALEATRKLVEMVGGSFHEVVGRSMPEALLDFARAENVTQVVLGASNRPRSRQLLRPSVINRVIRDSGPIDVHVISMSEAPPHEPLRATKVGGLSARRQVMGAVFALVTLPLLTVLLTASRDRVGVSSVLLMYLLVVVGTAAIGGLWPALAAAVASSLLTNYYFVPPIHTLTIAEPEHLFAIFVFVAVAAVVSGLVNRAARLRAEAQRGRAEAEALAHLAGRLVADDDPLPGLVQHVRTTFGLDAVSVLRLTDDGRWLVEADAGAGAPSTPEEGTETLDLGEDTSLVIRGPRLPAESRRVLAAFVAQLAVAVRARALKRDAEDAAELVEVNDLRAAILAAVSHDLRTPLASVKAAVSSLRQDDVTWNPDEVAEFLATIEEETDRLSSLVGNLLDASRIQTGSLRLVHHVVGLDEVVPKALASLSDHGRGIEVDVPETLPRVDVDAALLERAIANIASNALSHGGSDGLVRILGSEAGGRVELRIVDRGPGIPLDERQRVFEPFQRLGDRPSGDGVGLGLAVARGFVEAMGGEVEVEDTPGGGLTMVLAFRAEP
jgi:two-component system, OmpR family, sensor histidine kinase KdpD